MAKEYLERRGCSREVVEWKYFDPIFNRRRERGYGWIQDGCMRGFIGLIPFDVERGPERLQTAWLCDWSLEPGVKGGVGVMLVFQAFRSYPVLFGLGGNKRSRLIFARMADRTIQDAAIALYLPLRLGAALRALPPSVRFEKLEAIAGLPVRRLRSHPGETAVTLEDGVSRALMPMLERSGTASHWAPRYDFEYLHWQLGRCPDLICHTAYIPSDAGPQAAALLWHLRNDPSYWRMALIGEGADEDRFAPLVCRAARYVHSNGGHLLAALTSRFDAPRLRVLKAAGFLPAPRKRAVYALTGKNKPLPVDELHHLSYLDTDLAHFL